MKAGLLAVLLLAASAASAQGPLPDPGTLPDSPFYGLKRFLEGIGTALTLDQNAKASRSLELAELRLAEAQAMAQAGKPGFVQSLARDYEKEIASSNAAVASIENPEMKRVASERVAMATLHHADVLDAVKGQLPDQARSAIADARETSMQGNIRSLRMLASEDPERAAEIAIRAAQGRAEKARVAAENGDEQGAVEAAEEYKEYERFGQEISVTARQLGKDPTKIDELVERARSIHITVLEEVRTKVPDGARQFIDEALGESIKSEKSSADPDNDTVQDDDAVGGGPEE